jgi:hypothetical protein
LNRAVNHTHDYPAVSRIKQVDFTDPLKGRPAKYLKSARKSGQRIDGPPASFLPKCLTGFVIDDNIKMYPSQLMFPQTFETPVDHRPRKPLTSRSRSNHDMLEESTASIVAGESAAYEVVVIEGDNAQARVSGK